MSSSIHIEKVKTASFAHNDRTMKVSYLISSSKDNYCSCSSKEATAKFHELKSQAIENYTNRTKQSIQKKTIFLKEAIVNLEERHNENDLKPIIAKLESYGFTVLQSAIHRDEGFKDLVEGKKKHNYHAHITMFNLDVSTGKSVKFGKNYRTALSQLQTFVANTLGMERGKISDKTHARELQGEYNPKQSRRLGTHEYKAHAKEQEKLKLELTKENFKVLAKQEDLKKKISALRLELKENMATRPDYAKLEQLNKELKQQIKDKALTAEELEGQIQSLEYLLLNSKKENNKLEENNNTLINQNKILKTKNKSLGEELFVFKEKIVLRQDMSDLEIDNSYLEISNEHLEKKEIKIGLLKKEEIIVINNYFSFKQKIKSLILQGTDYIANKYQELKIKHNNLITRFNKLGNSYNEMAKEFSILELENKLLKNKLSVKDRVDIELKLKAQKDIFDNLEVKTDEQENNRETLKTQKQSFRKKRY